MSEETDDPSQVVNYSIILLLGGLILASLLVPGFGLISSEEDQTLYLEEPVPVAEAPSNATEYMELTERQKRQFTEYQTKVETSGESVELTGESASWSKDMVGIIKDEKYYPITSN